MDRKNQEGRGKISDGPPAASARRRRGKLLSVLPVFLLLLIFPSGILSQETGRLIILLKIKEKTIKAEVARTEAEKSRGLMFRQNLGKDEGMLFVYEKEERLSFWMKNTPLPLSIAFLDHRGRIVDIQNMAPFSLQTRISEFPAQYALEVNQGWFKANGFSVGDTVIFPASFKP